MTTINEIVLGLSGSTGTGNFAGSTSPTFVTPTIGAASATSINFGQSALSTYATTTAWTPAFTFATVGNLSNSYTTQSGYYVKIGQLVFITWTMIVTPTFTTSSGNAQITGLPFTSGYAAFITIGGDATAYCPSKVSVSSVYYYLAASSSTLLTYIQASGTSTTILTKAGMTSGRKYSFSGSMLYIASS